MAWGAAWLYRATDDATYKTAAAKHITDFKIGESTPGGSSQPLQVFWNDKTAAVLILMAKLTNDTVYTNYAKAYADFLLNKATKSPKGMVAIVEIWGPLRHSTMAAFMCLQVS